ncbi:MAG: sulfotransferase family 2 domain-containing protein [Alphaproteobacteria bacterium]|nr:sulfotransferase family 2 domain-containing protein [Alphaproteobacteria bacterium]
MKKSVYFIHIPKTAGTFLTQFLVSKLGKKFVREGHTVPAGVLKPWTERFGPEHYQSIKKEDCLTVSIVRNPFDLLVSMYVWGFPYWPPKNYSGTGYINWPFKSFRDFVEKITDRNGYAWIVPEQKKSLFFQVFGQDGRVIPDIIIRQEYLNDGIQYLGSVFEENWSPPSERINQSTTLPYNEFYDNELVQIVENFFEGDLRAFGYGFGYSENSAIVDTSNINCDIFNSGYTFSSTNYQPIRSFAPKGSQADINFHEADQALVSIISGRKLISETVKRISRRILLKHR